MDHFWVVLRPTRRLMSVLATSVLLLALAGCSFFGTTRAGPRHLVIATLFATSGLGATDELPAQYGVDLAVSQAHLPDGYTLGVVSKDEAYGSLSSTPTIGTVGAVTSEVQTLANNAQVIGMVGPLDSYGATLAMPITNRAGLSMINPVNTTPGLTLKPYALPSYGFNWALMHPAGHPDRFFRISANDVEQGQVDAYVAAHVLGAKTAFVLQDITMASEFGGGSYYEGDYYVEIAYHVELAQSFTAAFTSMPGHRLVAPPLNMCDVGCTLGYVAAILAKNPDLVFCAGDIPSGCAELKRYLVAAGYTRPLLGGDDITNDPAWMTIAQVGAANTYGTTSLPDISALTSPRARAFVAAYTTFVAGKPDNTLSPASVMAYDAANTLIAALTRAIQQGDGRSLSFLRAQTGADLASPNFQYAGLTGEITFDGNGDNVGQRIFSVYEVSSSADTAPQWSLFQLYQCSGGTTLRCQTISHL
jgi:ABC-type branched-subunit amino acid transport system substrate-binding protein